MTVNYTMEFAGLQGNRLNRLKQIDRLLRRNEMPTIAEAARRFSVDRRTIERDLSLLQKKGSVIKKIKGEKYPYRYLEKNFTFQKITVTEGELFFFLLGESALRQYKGTPFQDSIEAAYQKIMKYVLDKEQDLDMGNLFDSMHFDTGPITVKYDTTIFKCLIDSFREMKTVNISYFTASRLSSSFREIEPYHIANVAGEWYVIAYCNLKKIIRIFHINRIKSASLTNRNYDIPADFDAREHIARGFGIVVDGKIHTVKIRFSPSASVYVVDKEWHKDQNITYEEDDSVILEFTTEGIDAVKRWVLSFGGEAEVLEPQELKAGVKKEAERILGLCSGKQEKNI